MPFIGRGCKMMCYFAHWCIIYTEKDLEGSLVRELARWASLKHSSSEACSPEPDSFQVQELMVELEIDPVLRSLGNNNDSNIEKAWKTLVGNIQSHMADSKSVVVWGGNPVFRTKIFQGGYGSAVWNIEPKVSMGRWGAVGDETESQREPSFS